MARFEWNDSLSVGVKVIDEQHKVWIEHLNSLSAAIGAHQEARIISETLNFMVDYVEFHFAAEEKSMAAQNYPAFAEHKLRHEAFRNRLKELLLLEFGEEDAVSRLGDSINNFQISWLRNHIQQTDMLFAAFLREKGIVLHAES
jgi:hemerythrin-like metal-binding protein